MNDLDVLNIHHAIKPSASTKLFNGIFDQTIFTWLPSLVSSSIVRLEWLVLLGSMVLLAFDNMLIESIRQER
jgi:hypothetical protein